MMDRILDWLAGRTTRERTLIALCGLVALPLCLVFTVLLPLSEARTEAIVAREAASDLERWVIGRAQSVQALGPVTEAGSRAAIGSTGLEAALVEADLWPQVSDLAVQEGGVIELTFETVVFTKLADWVSRQAPDWGYDIGSFRLEALEETGRVSARFVLRPAG
mmetsp:Transcript_23981/g.43866  ORF Transcript_23981/g.43866 Transcript_23981/m.43866 type:complete len:164 (-) Transcript_23981:555-1046(-)